MVNNYNLFGRGPSKKTRRVLIEVNNKRFLFLFRWVFYGLGNRSNFEDIWAKIICLLKYSVRGVTSSKTAQDYGVRFIKSATELAQTPWPGFWLFWTDQRRSRVQLRLHLVVFRWLFALEIDIFLAVDSMTWRTLVGLIRLEVKIPKMFLSRVRIRQFRGLL